MIKKNTKKLLKIIPKFEKPTQYVLSTGIVNTILQRFIIDFQKKKKKDLPLIISSPYHLSRSKF